MSWPSLVLCCESLLVKLGAELCAQAPQVKHGQCCCAPPQATAEGIMDEQKQGDGQGESEHHKQACGKPESHALDQRLDAHGSPEGG